MMKKKFAAVVLASVAMLACHGKKPATAPATPDKALEQKDDSTGGATYGGHKADAPSGKNTPNPCAPH
jgi:uncharacterized lipoprotein YajG